MGENPFIDEHGNPRLPEPTHITMLQNPYAIVIDMTMPGPDGPVRRKLLRYADRSNPYVAFDVIVDEETAEKHAAAMTRRQSGVVQPGPDAVAKFGTQLYRGGDLDGRF